MRLRRIVAAAAFATVSVPALAQTAPGGGYGYGHGMMWGDGGWGMLFFGPLFMVVTVAAVIFALIFLVRWLGGVPGGAPFAPTGKTAVDILKDRFARGEIDKAEFEERRRVLGE